MMRRDRIGTRVAALIATLVVSACGTSRASPSNSNQSTLTVLAASSLTHVLPQIGRLFSREHHGTTLRFSFGGTDLLSAQIEQGARGDLFAGASSKYGDRLYAEHLVDQPRPFCTNRLVLIVPRSNPAGITSLRDLATKEARLVIGSATVPIGTYTRTVLRKLDASFGAGYSTRVLSRVVSNELDVESVLTKVRTGEADAGFVYVTDATAAGSAVTSIPLPQQAQAVANYPVAVISRSAHRSLAELFVEFVLSPAAQQVLRQAGFGPPLS
jgi:molybdate transport system substrate-binding protein